MNHTETELKNLVSNGAIQVPKLEWANINEPSLLVARTADWVQDRIFWEAKGNAQFAFHCAEWVQWLKARNGEPVPWKVPGALPVGFWRPSQRGGK